MQLEVVSPVFHELWMCIIELVVNLLRYPGFEYPAVLPVKHKLGFNN